MKPEAVICDGKLIVNCSEAEYFNDERGIPIYMNTVVQMDVKGKRSK